ncbi:hypothetical protein DSCA_52150 [Desulfosarcina alkanivorans]|jgi:predicted small secreted protein|uniref:Lipoprotein n=1 Tax=Desulfosarcina alkanivorans TaxID=571177 RepID=A0A5K7YSB6_9BACT|nr:hypothetical protein [Desulfosarcina alkanivorans]BBO71285.1 hypothetical protein DSCA_52150 [Desulfosarcina alkanivorans]
MKPAMAAVLILLCGAALAGCNGTSGLGKAVARGEAGPNGPSLSESPGCPGSDPFEIQGTIVRKDMEGGFYAIDGDDGRNYYPANLSESFRKDGLKVSVTARLKKDAMGIHMYGTTIEVVKIAAK